VLINQVERFKEYVEIKNKEHIKGNVRVEKNIIKRIRLTCCVVPKVGESIG
jgi:hypothetical protein